MEQALAVPLAFVQPPAEAGFNEAQAADLAQIASQFNAAVAATGQAPTDPAYATTYEEFRNLADEQVRAVSGDGAYEALVDARAQAAGNVTPARALIRSAAKTLSSTQADPDDPIRMAILR